jgi:putative N6-adenine-specific DNA methylase
MQNADPHQSATALERRIKRRLIGREQSFYAVTAPGMEALCRRELETHLASIAVEGVEKGGVAFTGRLHAVYAANLHCRTAHRFLMRVGHFRAPDFDSLLKKTAAIPWELYLPSDADFDVKVSAHRSRLYHSGAVAERVHLSVRERLAAAAPPPAKRIGASPRLGVHVRLTRDRCQLSVDSSGANLHKRGLRPRGGPAPLRETLAAGILMRAGFTGRETLCDPMCGSGTFAIEAALMAKQIPPGWLRPFAFQDWPAFREGRWRHLRRVAAPPATAWSQPLIHASDRRPAAVNQLRQILGAHGLDDVVRVSRTEFDDLDSAAMGPSGGIVVLNPPYGRRLGSRRSAEETYLRIGRRLKMQFRGWKAAVLAPSRRLADLLGLRARRYVLMHGGQRVHLLVGKIRA